MKKNISGIILFTLTALAGNAQKPGFLWKGNQFTLYADSIVQQNKFVAKAPSSSELVSNYKSPANRSASSAISFKFSINGKDNEMTPGMDHHFNVVARNGAVSTGLIKFGTQLNQQPIKKSFLIPNTLLTIRLDMRHVLKAFKEKGFYTLYNGEKIYKEDFKAVYVAGNTPPLMWDFNNLYQQNELELKDSDGDGIYETTLKMNAFEEAKQTAASWKLSKDITDFPQYSSGYMLPEAIYKMSIGEMIKAVEPDSTFRTGKEWAGVWTRDISYSIILSMAYLQPKVARNSLLKKVNKNKKIIQDTGTGGAWPVSSDRMIWAVAAWELYKVTGDKDWLLQAYAVIKNSLDDDYQNIYDRSSGMVNGESSFLDWREQTYPLWMQPADIFESQNLGTNAVHYEANIVAGKMAQLLGRDTEALQFNAAAKKIKTAINDHLWMADKNYYSQYRYGRINKIVSPRSEALGEALCVLFDIADKDKQKAIIENTPQLDFGIPCIYPQIPGIPPYHNNAVWPFVQSYWLWAAAKAGNEKAVLQSIASIYRPAAMFLTNKENFVANDGDFLGTQINSSNMLWSLSGNISIVHKVLFGISFSEDHLNFNPFIPASFKGKSLLTNFKYRDAILNIEMEGYGNHISSFMIDGQISAQAVFPAGMKGNHLIKIKLNSKAFEDSRVNNAQNVVAPQTPIVTHTPGMLSWQKIKEASAYKIFSNGKLLQTVSTTRVKADDGELNEYTVMAVDKNGVESFMSEPIIAAPATSFSNYEIEDHTIKADFSYNGFTGNGFVETSTTINTSIKIPVSIKEDGLYTIDCRYANGNGPINTENKCAIRTLVDNGKNVGIFVFPQRGTNEWSNWGYSNTIRLYLLKGDHIISIEYLHANENMNLNINQAMLDHLRVGRLK